MMDAKCDADENVDKNAPPRRKKYYKETAFMVGVTGISTMAGFGYTLTMAKKKDPNYFNKGLIGSKGIPDSGGALAIRALGFGTLYAVAGVGLLTLAVCGIAGIRSMDDLRTKVGGLAPSAGKENSGRSEFGSVRELVNYLVDEDKRTAEK